MARAALGLLLGLVARLWLASLRVTAIVHPALDACKHVPWSLAFWHGQILPLLAFRRRRRTVAMVSLSRDGDILAWAFKALDVGTVRGSSSRGGSTALAGIVDRMRDAWDGAFALDGPRGPRRIPHTGALVAASRSGGVVVPFVAACASVVRLRSSWDRFEIPLPFSRVVVMLGAPLLPAPALEHEPVQALADAVEAARSQAREALAEKPLPTLAPASEENT
ncbi:MAG: DUF374 domain-containing protein [Deltaproteobacteria bacterium]|nr:DUF374 domain-containing protein [Deltaproteobacteria bacterium]